MPLQPSEKFRLPHLFLSVKLSFFSLLYSTFFVNNHVVAHIYEENEVSIHTRIHCSALTSFYNNKDYVQNIKAPLGFCAGIKEELIFIPGISFLLGLDYLNHGLNFESYYFASGYSTIYDKKYNASHQLMINELQVPILLNFTFGNASVNANCLYFDFGWVYRHFFSARANIISKKDQKIVWTGNTELKMEYPLFNDAGGSMLQAGLGFQHNYRRNNTALFIEFTYKYGLSRFRYVGNGSSNNILISNSFASLGLGYKF